MRHVTKGYRKNYRFDICTVLNLKRLCEMTGQRETEVVEEAIAQYMRTQIRLQEELKRVQALEQ